MQSGAQFKFVRDKSEQGEFFLDVCQGDPHTTTKKRRIPIVDIEDIEPVQGTRFNLRYYLAQSWISAKKSLKVEVYESKHLADIMDCLEQVQAMVDESERRLDRFVQDQQRGPNPITMAQDFEESKS